MLYGSTVEGRGEGGEGRGLRKYSAFGSLSKETIRLDRTFERVDSEAVRRDTLRAPPILIIGWDPTHEKPVIRDSIRCWSVPCSPWEALRLFPRRVAALLPVAL